jgi:hypothetical protein
MGSREISLRACGCAFQVSCSDDATAALVNASFGGLAEEVLPPASAIRHYAIARLPGCGFQVSTGEHSTVLDDEDSLLFHLDGEIILALQYARSDLLFLHAAAVASADRVAVLSASSGTGKSTLTLATIFEGLNYLSDELAPIDLQRFTVEAYPRALCLKAPPPLPHVLPPGTIQYGGRFQVPVKLLPESDRKGPFRLAACVFLERDGPREGLRPISQASAVARVMANTLNSLAHANAGFDAAVTLSQAVPCFELGVNDLPAATTAIKDVLLGNRA